MPVKIFKRGNFWHYAGTVAGRRLRGTCRTSEKAVAQRIAAEREAKAWQRHLDGPGASMTFADAATAYREDGKPVRHLERVEDYFRDTPLCEINAGAIHKMAIRLFPDAKPATRNRQAIVPAQAIINFAAKQEWCPPIRVRRFKVDGKVKRPASREWITAFAAHSSPHLGALALFMFGTGARLGEAVALTWGDVDLARRIALIRQTKVSSERFAHLQGPVLEAIANIPSNRHPGEPVFRYMSRETVRKAWDAAIARAGIEALSPHCCRHGFATAMLRAGIDVKTVATMGGWKDVATVVKTYAHAIEDLTVTDAIFVTKLTQREVAQPVTIGKKRRKQ